MLAIVTGRGRFPLDMLRRDCAYPASEVDSYKIDNTFDEHSNWEIKVGKRPTNRNDGFTTARWESFGCKIEVLDY